jgi:hypothetical protein
MARWRGSMSGVGPTERSQDVTAGLPTARSVRGADAVRRGSAEASPDV